MANPLFFNNRGEDVNRPSNPLNEADKSYRQGYNEFDYDRSHFTTMSFADVTPFEAVEGVESDVLEFGSKHHIRTYTLSSPLFDELYFKKSYYLCDMRSLLPLNWDKVYREPSVGDDIPSDYVNCFTDKLFTELYNSLDVFKLLLDQDTESQSIANYDRVVSLNGFIRLLVLMEYIFSDASLFARFGYRFSSLLSFKNARFTDEFTSFDEYINFVYKYFSTVTPIKLYHVTEDFTSFVNIEFVKALDLVRSNPERFYFTLDNAYDAIKSAMSVILDDIISALEAFDSTDNFPINYSRIAAYQLVCAEYFTKDKIDNIYSAQLYHQNMRGIINRVLAYRQTDINTMFFIYNGVPTLYDSISGHCLNYILNSLTHAIQFQNMESFENVYGYLHNLFSINKSLRYGDYFTGARPEAYSPLDMTADVHDGKVSAIDNTRSILAQRFSNAVARTGRKFSDYLVDVTGGYDVPDVECPRWLASKTSRVDGFEVENTTSENQGNVVTVLNSRQSDFVYRVECGSPCIVIGVCTFSMQRTYASSVDKFCFKANRFDMFNKFMQYEGDQSVEARELSANLSDDFAYQLRHSEYKMRYPIVTGGWFKFLPSMFLIADKTLPLENITDHDIYRIDYFNIRNSNFEFDDFYSSLSNFGLASRFHFMMRFDNLCKANRKMARQPSIL